MKTSIPSLLRLYLIRHGKTEWSLSGRYTGCTDISLTAHGEDALRQLGLRLRDLSFTHVLSSPLQRAQQTCALAGLPLVVEIAPDLAEWDNGDYEGRTPRDILQSRPAIALRNSAVSQTFHPGHATTSREPRTRG